MSAAAILVAAGKGERLRSSKPKAFLELAGATLLVRSARAFQEAPSIEALVAVVPRDARDQAFALLAVFPKLVAVVEGGERRQDSVLCGLRALGSSFAGTVLVHDAARPFVDGELIERVVAHAIAHSSALPLLPVTDTIKRVREGQVVETLDRATLGAAQTPQGFDHALLLRACEAAERDGATVTDEAMAVERLGEPVFTVRGSPRNRKITTPDDWAWAEAFLAAGR